MRHIYHLLTESEPFSEANGGAISRWVANVVRHDDDAIVLAPSSDASWGFDPARIRNIPGLVSNKQFLDKGGYILPWTLRLRILKHIIAPALHDLAAGDTVWIHGRPEFAAALEPMIHARGARLFLHLHNSHLVQWSTRVTLAVHADCYVFVSRYLREEALQKFPELGRTEVLNNGADARLFYPSHEPKPPNKIPAVLFANRLVPDKGLHIFLEAMLQLSQQNIALEGVVVGASAFGGSAPTPYVLDMQAKAPANVRFAPYCSGPLLAKQFREADIYCLPACWNDPFPLAPLEAMASGVPVVASWSGGIPDQLAEGGGLLVPRNDVTALADAIALLATNTRLRHELAAQALKSFHKNFTWETAHANYRRILQQQRPQLVTAAEGLGRDHA
jgi:spore coat protein SA